MTFILKIHTIQYYWNDILHETLILLPSVDFHSQKLVIMKKLYLFGNKRKFVDDSLLIRVRGDQSQTTVGMYQWFLCVKRLGTPERGYLFNGEREKLVRLRRLVWKRIEATAAAIEAKKNFARAKPDRRGVH